MKSEDETTLKDLNVKIADAEMNRKDGFLDTVIADDLIFRRADGTTATKEQYLAGIRNPENTYSQVEASNVEVFVQDEGLALVSLIVRAAGVRGGKPFSGTFRNTRVFAKKPAGWRCVVWFNTREGDAR
jgi:ketosteroid isomerase-like protein